MKLLVERLSSGELVVRPEGALGTCGWHPRAWTIALVHGDPVGCFLDVNLDWTREDVSGVIWEL